MGYYMSLNKSEFLIKSENKNKALEAIRNIASSEIRFPWVSNDIVLEAKTLIEAMDEWRWEVEENDEGDINFIDFTGDKLGDDYELFCAIAPFVEDDSYIEMRGEEGDLWRWIFNNQKCKEIYPSIIW